MTKIHYRLKHHTEEGYCQNCAAGLFVGDKAVEGEHGIYCCEPCWQEVEGPTWPATYDRDDDYPS